MSSAAWDIYLTVRLLSLSDKVVLIDGETLANLMIDHGVGVALEEAYEIKRVDFDYFNEV